MATSSTAAAAVQEKPVFYAVEKDHHPENGTLLGFWIYLMSDCLIFAILFACFGLYAGAYAAGPSGAALFDLRLIALNTGVLLVSSLTFGMAMLAMEKGRKAGVLAWLAVTGLLGLVFLSLEIYEFAHLIEIGAGPQRSAFLSAFFVLVGTHGLHVTFGVIWLVILMIQISKRGLDVENQRRLTCLSMFWHFLDVIWIGVFSFVYLMGSLS